MGDPERTVCICACVHVYVNKEEVFDMSKG